MGELLNSPSGTFLLFIASVGPFLWSGMSSIVRWHPGGIVLSELLLILLVGVAWAVSNLLATWILGFVFINSLAMVSVGWWKQRQSASKQG